MRSTWRCLALILGLVTAAAVTACEDEDLVFEEVDDRKDDDKDDSDKLLKKPFLVADQSTRTFFLQDWPYRVLDFQVPSSVRWRGPPFGWEGVPSDPQILVSVERDASRKAFPLVINDRVITAMRNTNTLNRCIRASVENPATEQWYPIEESITLIRETLGDLTEEQEEQVSFDPAPLPRLAVIMDESGSITLDPGCRLVDP